MAQLTVGILVSRQTKEPRVELSQPGTEWLAQLSVTEARALGISILEAAEAAVSDGFLYDYMVKVVDLDEGRTTHVLNDFRGYRSAAGAWPRVVNLQQPEEELGSS